NQESRQVALMIRTLYSVTTVASLLAVAASPGALRSDADGSVCCAARGEHSCHAAGWVHRPRRTRDDRKGACIRSDGSHAPPGRPRHALCPREARLLRLLDVP